MKKMRLAATLLFTVLLAGVLFTTDAAPIFKRKVKPAKTLLVFEKKPCFGYCPVYKATFLDNGKVTVNYQQRGKPAGTAAFNLSKAEVLDLWKRGEKLGFFTMKDRYDTQKTDWPEREIILYKNGKPKPVVYYEGGPWEFEAYLADIAAIVENYLKVDFNPPGR